MTRGGSLADWIGCALFGREIEDHRTPPGRITPDKRGIINQSMTRRAAMIPRVSPRSGAGRRQEPAAQHVTKLRERHRRSVDDPDPSFRADVGSANGTPVAAQMG